MTNRTGRRWTGRRWTGWPWTGRRCVALALLAAASLPSQTLTNQALTGKYFFRHVSLGANGVSAAGAINLTDARSLQGAITFDGSGRYSFTGQQVAGNNPAASASGAGTYSVDAGGFVALDSPLRSGARINARYGPEALIGSATETADNTFDLFVAIPAPSG